MRVIELFWDDHNIEHIAQHAVNPREVEDVCFGTHISRKGKGQRYILSGQTENGRYLNVVIEKMSGGTFRPITAFDMSQTYKRRYRRKLQK